MSASHDIERIDEQVTWELLKCEGRWYVTVSHHSLEDSFKWQESSESLDAAIHAAAVWILDLPL